MIETKQKSRGKSLLAIWGWVIMVAKRQTLISESAEFQLNSDFLSLFVVAIASFENIWAAIPQTIDPSNKKKLKKLKKLKKQVRAESENFNKQKCLLKFKFLTANKNLLPILYCNVIECWLIKVNSIQFEWEYNRSFK